MYINEQKLTKIKEKALKENIPIIMDDTLELLGKILKVKKAKNILEIGTAIGYSAICFAEYLEDNGKIDTIEREEERILEAEKNINEFGLKNNIQIFKR